MADKVRENLDRIMVKGVEVVLSERKVTPGLPTSGLWPRVTLALGTKERVVPLTDMANPTAKIRGRELNKLQKELLRLAGARTTGKLSPGRKRSLDASEAAAFTKIAAAIRAAAVRKTGIGERVQKAQRKSRKESILKTVHQRLHDVFFQMKVEPDEVRPSEVAKVWEDLVKDKTVRGVMET